MVALWEQPDHQGFLCRVAPALVGQAPIGQPGHHDGVHHNDLFAISDLSDPFGGSKSGWNWWFSTSLNYK